MADDPSEILLRLGLSLAALILHSRIVVTITPNLLHLEHFHAYSAVRNGNTREENQQNYLFTALLTANNRRRKR